MSLRCHARRGIRAAGNSEAFARPGLLSPAAGDVGSAAVSTVSSSLSSSLGGSAAALFYRVTVSC
jgi:hypothetical protein